MNKILVSDIDFTAIKGGNMHHVDAYVSGINKVFDLDIATEDIQIEKRQGKIDNQIILEVLAEKGIQAEEAMKALHEIVAVVSSCFLEAYKNPKDVSDQCMSGIKVLFRTIKQLRGTIAVLSGNIDAIAWARMEKMKLREFVCAGAFGNQALQRGGLFPVLLDDLERSLQRRIAMDNIVVLDDASLGVIAAKQNGARVIGVATGHSSMEELFSAGADLVVPNLMKGHQQIISFLR